MQSRKYNYLVADDEPNILKIISDILTLHPNTLSVFTAKDGEKALQIYMNNNIDIVITDVLMPRISGLDLIKKIRELNHDANIIIVSASSNLNVVREALRNGAYDYILKPFSLDDIMFSVNRIIERLRLLEEKKSYLDSLELEIGEVSKKLKSSFLDALRVIINALEVKDKTIKIHSLNVAKYSIKLASAIGLSGDVMDNIETGSFLHDIGKIGIPDNILMKPTALTKEEFEIIKKHPVLGRQIIEPMFGKNEDIINIIYYHHERYDGGGYPEGLQGDKIPLVGRISALVNSYDAMISEKPYRKPKIREEAVIEITKNMGTQFDPDLSKEFIKLI